MEGFLETLRERVLCGDGAIGTLLAERGVPAGSCFEELCLSRPELISSLHADYLAAVLKSLQQIHSEPTD